MRSLEILRISVSQNEELKIMLSSLVQEHNARQAGNKARQERLRQEANKAAGEFIQNVIGV